LVSKYTTTLRSRYPKQPNLFINFRLSDLITLLQMVLVAYTVNHSTKSALVYIHNHFTNVIGSQKICPCITATVTNIS